MWAKVAVCVGHCAARASHLLEALAGHAEAAQAVGQRDVLQHVGPQCKGQVLHYIGMTIEILQGEEEHRLRRGVWRLASCGMRKRGWRHHRVVEEECGNGAD